MSSSNAPRPDVLRELQASRLIYPFYRKLIERFELEMFPCKDLEEPSSETPEALARVRLWFAEADKHIEAAHIRQLLQDEAMDEPTLRFLIWRHVAKEGKTDSDRFKVDFLLGNYLAQNMPADLAKDDVRASAVASILEPVVGESDYLTYVEDLEECVRELRDCRHLEDLLERNILERGKNLKAAAGETFFHQAGLIAFTRFNFLTRRRVVDLLNTDLEEISGLVGEVQHRSLQAVDCTAAGLNATESSESLRERIKQWRKPFQGKYSNMEWLQQISNLRKVLKSTLDEAHKAADAAVATPPAAPPEEEEALKVTKAATSVPAARDAVAPPDTQPATQPAAATPDAVPAKHGAGETAQPKAPGPAKVEVAKVARLPEKPPPPDLRAKKPAVPPKQVAPKATPPVAPRKNGSGTLIQRIGRWYKDLSAGFAPAKPARVSPAPSPKPVRAAEKPAAPVSAAVVEKPAAPAPPAQPAPAPAVAAAKSPTASARIVQPSARVPEAIKRVSQHIASLPAEANGALTIGETSLSLSPREMGAFRKPNENLSGIFQRSAAVRLLLSEALGKAENDRAALAPMLKFAYSESTLLNDRIAQVKNNKDVDGVVALTASSKALAALSEKIEESLTQIASASS